MPQHNIVYHQAFPVLKLNLAAGDSIKANGNAMVAMSGDVKLTGRMEGGVVGSLWRSFSGESFFLQRYEAKSDGWVWLGPHLPGGVMHLPIATGTTWAVNKGGFLAGTAGVEVSTKAQNIARGFFSGEGLFVVKLSGEGDAWLATFGGIETITLADGEECTIDFGRLVAWPADMKYSVTVPAKGVWSAIITGEILGCRFTGPGTIYVQTLSHTHCGAALADMINPYIPKVTK